MRRLANMFLIVPLLGVMGLPATALAATTAEELLSGMVTEELEPGVFRVDNDGVRDLSRPGPDVEAEPFDALSWFWGEDELYTGLDGSVWLVADGRRAKLGESGLLKPAGDAERFWVSTDGTPWLLGGDRRLYSYDGDEWQMRFDGRDVAKRMQLRLTSDDDVWLFLSTDRPGRYRVRHFDGTDWSKLPRPAAPADLPEARLERWSIGEDGSAWIMRRDWLFHYDGQGWSPVGRYPHWESGSASAGNPLVFMQTPDGVLHALADLVPANRTIDSYGPAGTHDSLRIPELPGWESSFEDGIDTMSQRSWALAPDGTFWRALGLSTCRPGTLGWGCQPYVTACDGLARFDGERWARYLPGHCVVDFDFGPDGSVWARAMTTAPGPTVTPYTGEDAWQDEDRTPVESEMETLALGQVDLYVITPEAMAEAE